MRGAATRTNTRNETLRAVRATTYLGTERT
jgi:hypothetical protein